MADPEPARPEKTLEMVENPNTFSTTTLTVKEEEVMLGIFSYTG